MFSLRIIFVISTWSQKRNSSCNFTKCSLCNGSGHVNHESPRDSILTKKLLSPCPGCNGFGMIPKDSCSPLTKVLTTFALSIPSGSYPYYSITILGQGNDHYLDDEPKTGNFVATVSKVRSGNIQLIDKTIQITVRLTAKEALNVLPMLSSRMYISPFLIFSAPGIHEGYTTTFREHY